MYPSNCLCIIACGKNKVQVKSKAANLYKGTSFICRRDFAIRNFNNWCILSAKYSILLPDDLVAPYDLNMKDLTKEDRAVIFKEGVDTIKTIFSACNKFYLILPAPYDEFADYLNPLGECIFPTAGLQGRAILHYLKTGISDTVDVDKIISAVCSKLDYGKGYPKKVILSMIKEQLPSYSLTYFKRILNSSTVDGEGEKGLRFRRIFEVHDDLYYLVDSYNELSVTKIKQKKLF